MHRVWGRVSTRIRTSQHGPRKKDTLTWPGAASAWYICSSMPASSRHSAISSSTRALVHEVIPFIDVLTKHVDDFTDNPDLTPAVRAAAQRGRLLLDQYYSKTDETDIYRSAMCTSSRLLHVCMVAVTDHS